MTITESRQQVDGAADGTTDTDRYMIVSMDSHCDPLTETQLREYCPAPLLDQYDEFVAQWKPTKRSPWADDGYFAQTGVAPFTDAVKDRTDAITATAGVYDPHVRLKDMDDEGIAAEVLYHGAMTGEAIPWMTSPDASLRTEGVRIYNRWLRDFVAVAPNRFIGAAHMPMWDLDATIEEAKWVADSGLQCVNFPAPNRQYTAYNDPAWEPFWAICEEANLPLTTHGGSGDMPEYTGPDAWALYMSDLFFYSRRGLHYLIWSGAFERHPNLKMIFTEQRSEWVPSTLAHLDSIYASEFHDWKSIIPRKPSEYFEQNCWVASSFMARFEAEMRHEIGIDKLMWGSDYPHYEGSYGFTDLHLRQSFADMPVDDVRKILGENALALFDLDRVALRDIADRIGPSPAEVSRPLDASELPDVRGCAFRTISTWG